MPGIVADIRCSPHINAIATEDVPQAFTCFGSLLVGVAPLGTILQRLVGIIMTRIASLSSVDAHGLHACLAQRIAAAK